MANNLWNRWQQASYFVRFFTNFPARLHKQSDSSDVPSALRQKYKDLFLGTNAACKGQSPAHESCGSPPIQSMKRK